MNPAISEMTVTYLVDATNSAVPQGYKQTDVGIIPDDWLCTDIGALNPFVTSGSRGWAEFYSEYGQPFVRITNTKRHSIYLDLSDLKFVNLPETSSEGKRTSLVNGDVLISITADIGISSYVDDSLGKPAYINQHIALVRFDLDEINSKFVTYFLSSENVQKLFRSTSDQGAKAGLNLDSVRKIKIALPSQSEQTAIANALSDVDALIQELEKLIAKKQAIKTANMQQLLTGRTRLPQFALHPDGRKKGYKPSELGEIPEDWEISDLSSLKPFVTSGSRGWAEFYSAFGDSFVRITNMDRRSIHLDTSDIKYVSVSGSSSEGKRTALANGDVLISITADIGICSYVDEALIKPAYINQHIALVRFDLNITDSKFIAYYLASEPVQRLFLGSSDQGAKAGMNLESVRRLQVVLPAKKEQMAIATILSDMDTELQTLAQRLSKTRQIKQGMMQELLTGKTRLVKPVGAA